MIVFLTLCYAAVLALLVKLKIIKLTLGWKLSPLAFLVVCLVVLVFPMQWGAPSGVLNVYQGVVEIIPNVSGEVIEVMDRPLEPLKKGEVLFKIDPQLFQSEVDRLEAALKEAEQSAKLLPVDLAAAKAAVAKSEAALVDAKQQVRGIEAVLSGSKATVQKVGAQLEMAQAKYDRTVKLHEKQAASQQELETEQRNLEAAKASFKEAEAGLEQSQSAFDSQIGGVNTAILEAEAVLSEARATQSKSQIQIESVINGENTLVAQLRAQLAAAKLNLDYATVRAPGDGYVIGLSLRPGQRVANFPVRSWVSFVEPSRTRLAVAINQNALRHVAPGQRAEIVFKVKPGRTISARVESIVTITSAGQLQASGLVPTMPTAQSLPYGAVLAIDDDADFDVSRIPGGAAGYAAIYTENAKATHVIRRVELRMKSWLNYVIP